MAFVSVTRLRVRTLRFLVPFLIATRRSRQQLRRAAGFLEGRLTLEWPLVFWTMTVWTDQKMMLEFRNHAPHKDAMVRLLDWCDEASYVHWEQPDAKLPPGDVAHSRLRQEGKTSKVRHPTPAHASGRTVSDKRPSSTSNFGPA